MSTAGAAGLGRGAVVGIAAATGFAAGAVVGIVAAAGLAASAEVGLPPPPQGPLPTVGLPA